MRRSKTPFSEILIRGLNRFIEIDPSDEDLIGALAMKSRNVPAGVLFPQQKRPYSSLVIAGWVGRLRFFSDGRRQVLTTIVPGELVGPYPNTLVSMVTVALTDVITLDLTPLLEAVELEGATNQNIRKAMMIASMVEEAQLAEQVVRLGRRTALERLGHWLLELQHRLAATGLVHGDRFPMPLSQELIGDVLGLSIVHVNRIVQQLRREGLAEIKGGYATILKPDRLRMITDFTPAGQPSGQVDFTRERLT